MTDHAKTIRDALMWAQAYAPDRLAHRLIDAEESLRELLAGHAAEVEQLRQEAELLRRAATKYLAGSGYTIERRAAWHREAIEKGWATCPEWELCAALTAAQEPPSKGDDRDE